MKTTFSLQTLHAAQPFTNSNSSPNSNSSLAALRCNLDQVLAQIQDDQQQQHQEQVADEAQSCCGSNSDETVAAEARSGDHASSSIKANRMCRKCGKEESCVLLLPCRHLCLCTFCGSSLHTCPVCNSNKTASVHVNLSAS